MKTTKEPPASEEVIASDILKTDMLGRITVGRAQRERILDAFEAAVFTLAPSRTKSCRRGRRRSQGPWICPNLDQYPISKHTEKTFHSFPQPARNDLMLPAELMPLSNDQSTTVGGRKVVSVGEKSPGQQNTRSFENGGKIFRKSFKSNDLSRKLSRGFPPYVTLYGYRHYTPKTGQFLGRDPIEEEGGIHLHGFVGNDGVNRWDSYGLYVGNPPGIINFGADGPIGEPGFGESLIPVWGSGRSAINDYQNGKWAWGTINLVIAVTDVFLIKSLATAAGKGTWKCGSNSWRATRSWYAKRAANSGIPLPYKTEVHHWAVSQNGTIVQTLRSNGISDDLIKKIINQPWNLKPMIPKNFTLTSQQLHQVAHGVGKFSSKNPLLNAYERWNVGSPTWAKIGEANLTLRVTRFFESDDCQCPIQK